MRERAIIFMLLSPDRGRGWERGLQVISQRAQPPLLASPPSGGEEHESRPSPRHSKRSESGSTMVNDPPGAGAAPG